MHDVAGIHKTQADAAADRRGDTGIGELQLGVVDLTLIRRDGAIKLADERGLGIELLLGDHAFLKKKLESFEINLGVSAQSLIFGQLPLGLRKLDLEGTRIDLREKLSFVDELALPERDTRELAVHATANRDGVEGGDGADAIEIDGQVAPLGGGNYDRHNQVACAEASLALAGCSGHGGVGCRAGVPFVAVIPATDSDSAKNESPEPPAALGRDCGRSAAGTRLGEVYGLGLSHPLAPVRKSDCARESAESRAIASRRWGCGAW